MTDFIQVTGMILSVMPMGENDRRVQILTAEMGKISAFIRGGRKTGSPLLAAGRLFACGRFELYPGRSAYTVKSADIQEYFEFIASDPEALCYASYFAELAAWFSRENIADPSLLKLLYSAIRSLDNPRLMRPLIRYVFEYKLIQIEGEALPDPPYSLDESAWKAWQYVREAEIDKCFLFVLKADSFRSFSQAVAAMRNEVIDVHFNSLKVLEEYLALGT